MRKHHTKREERRAVSHRARVTHRRRAGYMLVIIAIALPMLFGMLGLIVDGGLLMAEHRRLQTLADAAATAAARRLGDDASSLTPVGEALALVHVRNELPDVTVTTNNPPTSGPYAGDTNYVEVILTRTVETNFIQVVRGEDVQTVRVRAVAGVEQATAGGVFAVLDPAPSPVTISGLPGNLLTITLPPVQLGGLEVLGLGQLKLEGALFVNTEWKGVDEHGETVGEDAPLGPLQHAISCMPLLPLTKLRAEDIWVTGGVGDPDNYGHFESGESSPLQANKPPVPDPLASLPVPTVSVDPSNVSSTEHGGRTIISLPLIGPTVRLDPGVYEWIDVITGTVRFNPGVYIIRGANPLTGISLSLVAGTVRAEGVMFYITDSPAYTPSSGLPDANDGETIPPTATVPSMLPSVVINTGLLGSRFSGLDDPGSPFDGMFLYQRRTMRKPMVIVAEQLLLGSDLAGTVYSKWGQLLFVGHGNYDLRFAVGTARVVNVLGCTFAPTKLFPPVEEIFLVE